MSYVEDIENTSQISRTYDVIGTKIGISDCRSRRLSASEIPVCVPVTSYFRLLIVVFCYYMSSKQFACHLERVSLNNI